MGAMMVIKMCFPDVSSDDVSLLLYIHLARLTDIRMSRSMCLS